jgi:hypothetical protein
VVKLVDRRGKFLPAGRGSLWRAAAVYPGHLAALTDGAGRAQGAEAIVAVGGSVIARMSTSVWGMPGAVAGRLCGACCRCRDLTFVRRVVGTAA